MKQTRSQINEKQRMRRKLKHNNYTKAYEKTFNGFLMRLYRNMTSRINGIQIEKHHLYDGKSILNKDNFYSWANNGVRSYIMFKRWTKNKYDRKQTPSVDRINSCLGYNMTNMEWVTHSENSRRGSINRWRKYS